MGFIENFNYYYYDLADPRIKDMFLMGSVWSPILIILIYVFVIFKIAPDYMKNRPAYKLNTFIKCYNLFQVIVNAYIVKEFSSCFPFSRTFECRPFVYSTDACAMKVLTVNHVTMVLKLLDLIETVIYILRKKNNQVTALHVYHHISTALIGMTFSRYFVVEQAYAFPIINCSVHVIMYSYYFLSNFEGPIKQMIVPYKRYLTIIQMGQFIFFFFGLIVHAFPEDCQIPRIPKYIMLLNLLFNFGLFFNFYKRAYIDKKRKQV